MRFNDLGRHFDNQPKVGPDPDAFKVAVSENISQGLQFLNGFHPQSSSQFRVEIKCWPLWR